MARGVWQVGTVDLAGAVPGGEVDGGKSIRPAALSVLQWYLTGGGILPRMVSGWRQYDAAGGRSASPDIAVAIAAVAATFGAATAHRQSAAAGRATARVLCVCGFD